MSAPEPIGQPALRIIEPLAAVRANPDWYFRNGEFSPRELIGLVTREALSHGSTDVTARELAGWWVVESSHDWLDDDLGPFFTLAPDPRAGENTSRIEILTTAFCDAVWTSHRGQPHEVSGTVKPPAAVLATLTRTDAGRTIAVLAH